LAFNGLLAVVSQKTEIFIITFVRTSNPTKLKADGRFFYPIELLDMCSEASVRLKQQSGV
jgi:hypothetical protein